MHRLGALLEGAVLILQRNLAELLENLLEWAFRQSSESTAEVTHCELKLSRHPVQSDENIQVDECLHNVLLLSLLQVVPAMLASLLRKNNDEAAQKLSQLFGVFSDHRCHC